MKTLVKVEAPTAGTVRASVSNKSDEELST